MQRSIHLGAVGVETVSSANIAQEADAMVCECNGLWSLHYKPLQTRTHGYRRLAREMPSLEGNFYVFVRYRYDVMCAHVDLKAFHLNQPGDADSSVHVFRY